LLGDPAVQGDEGKDLVRRTIGGMLVGSIDTTATCVAKIVVVLLAGLAVWLHQRATTKGQLALWGSVGGVASVAALVMGILLAG